MTKSLKSVNRRITRRTLATHHKRVAGEKRVAALVLALLNRSAKVL